MRLLGIVSVMLAMCLSFAVRGESAADAAKAAAEKGDAAAQFRYAEMLRTGNGVASNLTEAVVWTRKAAEGGCVDAQFRYGEMLRDGAGVKKNVIESVTWIRKAADAGLASAQCQMGLFYINGLGVDFDEDKAVEWLKKAAAQKHIQAQYNLGLCYARYSDDESVRLTIKWLNEAAKQDYADAQFNLAKLYLNPHHKASREQNAGRRAISLLRLAAAQNHAGAKRTIEELGCTAPKTQEKSEDIGKTEGTTNNAL